MLEEKILEDQLEDLIGGNKFYNYCIEYSERKSLEAKIVKDADNLEQMLLEKEYFERGVKIAGDWMNSPSKITRLYTDISKDLAKQIISTPINEWWGNLWTNKRIKA